MSERFRLRMILNAVMHLKKILFGVNNKMLCYSTIGRISEIVLEYFRSRMTAYKSLYCKDKQLFMYLT